MRWPFLVPVSLEVFDSFPLLGSSSIIDWLFVIIIWVAEFENVGTPDENAVSPIIIVGGQGIIKYAIVLNRQDW